ncbi:hypothetical protein ACIRL2_43970 [Embleya sp. NPDC127516]
MAIVTEGEAVLGGPRGEAALGRDPVVLGGGAVQGGQDPEGGRQFAILAV